MTVPTIFLPTAGHDASHARQVQTPVQGTTLFGPRHGMPLFNPGPQFLDNCVGHCPTPTGLLMFSSDTETSSDRIGLLGLSRTLGPASLAGFTIAMAVGLDLRSADRLESEIVSCAHQPGPEVKVAPTSSRQPVPTYNKADPHRLLHHQPARWPDLARCVAHEPGTDLSAGNCNAPRWCP